MSGRDRSESLDVVELRALSARHPELAPAVDLQIELLEIQRRVLPRITLPAVLPFERFGDGPTRERPLLTWRLLPIEWTVFRGVLREMTEALQRFGDIEDDDATFLTTLARDGDRLRAFVEAWFRDRFEDHADVIAGRPELHSDPRVLDHSLDSVMTLAFKPFLARCAEAFAGWLSVEGWQRGSCPLCHGEPELSIHGRDTRRHLVCGRCSLRWPFANHRCPFCANSDRAHLPTFTGADHVYWLLACDVCLRYVKAIDEHKAGRSALPAVDAIATLPLDALALQRGYHG